MRDSVHDVAIVGAGAAGLATAVFAARQRPGSRIALLDGARTLGAKILVSGGGRCNVTNAEVTERDFNGSTPAAIRRVLRAFTATETVAWFRELGVALHEEPLGKLFPDTNRARTVLDALVGEARARGVEVLAGHRVSAVDRHADAFLVSHGGGVVRARTVVLATGGLALPKSGSDGAGYEFARQLGHSLVATTPALTPLLLDGGPHTALQGVAHDVTLTLVTSELVDAAPDRRARRVDGALLWTHFGVSGPAALDLSRHWLRAALEGRIAEVSLAAHPFTSFEVAEAWLVEAARSHPRAHVESVLAHDVPHAVAAALLHVAGLEPGTPTGALTRERRRSLAHAVSALHLPVSGSRGYTHAEATAGGVPLAEVHLGTMESRRSPGLFLVGELLDVDGRLGGFNFQWAWSSAAVAARGVAQALAVSAVSS